MRKGAVMDIFTTQLTKVQPVPIKPEKLKVKALVKEAASAKLTDDIDHLENHESYLHFAVYGRDGKKHEDKEHQGQQHGDTADDDDEQPPEHLDIFV